MKYAFKSASQIRADAQVAGEICSQLEMNGGLTPKRLLDASRAEDAPLHGSFEWDDGAAAEKYREQQAGQIIRCLVVVDEGHENSAPVRAFFAVTEAREYTSTNIILRNQSLTQELLERAYRELRAYREKYRALKELAGLFAVIDDTLKNSR